MNLKKNILIVDDSRTVRQLLKMVLSSNMPCRVSEASDGQDAVEKLGTEKFDLVITDINMPRMDGLEFIKKVRDEMSNSVPIIVITTKGAERDRDTGLSLGADSYITKPLNGSNLLKTVSALASG